MIKNVVLFINLLVLLSACGGQTKKEETDEGMAVKVVPVELTVADANREFTFISKPYKKTDLSFRVSGPIDRFEVYAGNYYRRGDVIAEIDSRDFRIRKERAEAVYRQAKSEFERIKVLFQKDNVSASTYEKANAEYTSAKTAFDTATNELNDTKLLAPFNGYIGDVFIEKFQDVKASQPIVSFVDIDQLKIETYVTQDIAVGMKQLSTVELSFDVNPGEKFQAKVVEVSKSTTQNNLSYLLTALLPNQNHTLLSGMSGKMRIDSEKTSSAKVLSVPQTAICHRPSEGDYVWKIDAATKKVIKTKVSLGTLLPGGRIVIADGLQMNDQVAVSRLRFLSDGMKVKIKSSKDRS